MAKKNKQPDEKKISGATAPFMLKSARRQTLLATGLYFCIASALTFPLIFRMNSSVYGPYDHITTDLFANIYSYFWWLKEAILNLKISPFNNPFLAAPFETRMNFVNVTGFVQLPITVIFGHVFSRNFTILFNLIVSGLGMFLLVRHLTKSAGAGFIAGIVFAFCPNMMVRSYTTFDSTQAQWIPLYTLYVIKFIENRTWKNALLSGLFLVCHILISFPYYLVYLPVHTLVMIVSISAWHIWGGNKGFGGFIRDITNPEALRAYGKIIAVLGVVIAVFVIFYSTVVGGLSTMESFRRTTEQLEELALKPADYLMPHPSSALFKGTIKASYWDAKRPHKDPNTFVAYTGYIAIILMILGIIKGRGFARWLFIAGAGVAFWSTLGPELFGVPTPSGIIHSLYAPFARRIMIYKVFVQLCVAGLAGMGVSFILKWFGSNKKGIAFLVVTTLFITAEYSLVPPALTVNLTENPELYDRIHDLPDDSIVLEVPVFRYNHIPYPGYLYYQTIHGKRLFNPQLGVSGVPEHIRPFYKQMEVPFEACEYFNLAAMRYLGVTHLTYHWFTGTRTVQFAGLAAPALYNTDVEGLKVIYECNRDPLKGPYRSPYDYTFADLYEITAEPSPIALVFDYHSPYEQVPGIIENDFPIRFGKRFIIGWASALIDTTSTFYYPLPNGEKIDRVLRQGGRIKAINLSSEPVDFSVAFVAESPDSGRVIEAKWNNGPVIGSYEIGPETAGCMVEPLHLEGNETGELRIWSIQESYGYGLGADKIPAKAVLRNFRVHSNIP